MASANFMGSTYYENGKDVWLTSSLKLKNLSYLLEEMARWCLSESRTLETESHITFSLFVQCLTKTSEIWVLTIQSFSISKKT